MLDSNLSLASLIAFAKDTTSGSGGVPPLKGQFSVVPYINVSIAKSFFLYKIPVI